MAEGGREWAGVRGHGPAPLWHDGTVDIVSLVISCFVYVCMFKVTSLIYLLKFAAQLILTCCPNSFCFVIFACA